MSNETLERLLKSIKTDCEKLQNSKKELVKQKTSLKELKKDPIKNKMKIKSVENSIKKTEQDIRAAGLTLETDGKGLITSLIDLNSHDLTPSQKEYWSRFKNQVMAKWDMSAKDSACKILMDF
jgi:predicted  nucleic acid-binding Zn-ribbon protein